VGGDGEDVRDDAIQEKQLHPHALWRVDSRSRHKVEIQRKEACEIILFPVTEHKVAVVAESMKHVCEAAEEVFGFAPTEGFLEVGQGKAFLERTVVCRGGARKVVHAGCSSDPE
jgi:hypothetical protein